jgi:cell division protein FtsN
MTNRTFLWILFAISLFALILSGIGMIYFTSRDAKTPIAADDSVVPETPQIETAPNPPPVSPKEEEPSPPEIQEPVQEEPAEPVQEPPAPPVEPKPSLPAEKPADKGLAEKEYYYWLLAASTKTLEEAEVIATELNEYDLGARINTQGQLYEVRIGPYDAVEEAEFASERVAAFDFIESVQIKIILNRKTQVH